MASIFLKRRAEERAKIIDKEYGKGTYGSTTDLNKKREVTKITNSKKSQSSGTTKKNTEKVEEKVRKPQGSSFIELANRAMAEERKKYESRTTYGSAPKSSYKGNTQSPRDYSSTVKYLEAKGVRGASGIMTENEWRRRKGASTNTYQDYLDGVINKYGKGNIDLTDRPVYKNPDGTISTVASHIIGADNKYFVLPSIVRDKNGNVKKFEASDDVYKHFKNTGEYLGIFDTQEEAVEYAQNLYIEQQAYYLNNKKSSANSYKDVKEIVELIKKIEDAKSRTTDDYFNKRREEEIARLKNAPQADNIAYWETEDAKKEVKELTKQLNRYIDGAREANFYDSTIGAFKRSYYNMKYGKEAYEEKQGRENEADKYKELLASDEFNTYTDNKALQTLQFIGDWFGQQLHIASDPRTAASVATAGTMAWGAGQLVPLPEEVLTVPGAMYTGYKASAAINTYEASAGHTYETLKSLGVSDEVASIAADGVGFGVGMLEAIQLDELVDAYVLGATNGASDNVLKIIGAEILKRAKNTTFETTEEVLQEIVTIAGEDVAYKVDKGEHLYTTDEVKERLGETAATSFMGFGAMNVPAVAFNTTRAVRNDYVEGKIANLGKQSRDEVQYQIDKGLKQTEGTTAQKLATELKDKEYISDKELGNLVLANEFAFKETMELDFARDPELLKSLINEAKEVGGKSKNLANKVEKKLNTGNEVSVEDVKKLITANEVYIANENKIKNTTNNTTTLEKQVREKTGYGNYGVREFSNLLENSEDGDFDLLYKNFNTAYEMGLKNPDYNAESITNDTIQRTAFNAGKLDYLDKIKNKQIQAKNNVVWGKESGFNSNNAPSDVKKWEIEATDTIAKMLQVKAGWAEQLKGNAEIENNQGIITFNRDFERYIGEGKDRRKVGFVYHAAHEMGIHRVIELAPKEGMAFVRELYSYMTDGMPTNISTPIQRQRASYKAQGVELDAISAMEELSAYNILELYNNNEQKYAEAMRKIAEGNNQDAKTGMQKFLQIINDIIDSLMEIWNKLTGNEKAEMKSNIDELTRLKDMYEDVVRSAVKNAKAIEARNEKNSANSKNSLENKTEKGYNEHKSYALKSKYNEYNSIGMRWAYHPDTQVGDQKVIYNSYTNKYVLVEATKDGVGFVEVWATTYEQKREDEKIYESNEKGEYTDDERAIDTAIHNFENGQDDDSRNNVNVGNRGRRVQNAEVSKGKSDSNGTADSKSTEEKLNKNGNVFIDIAGNRRSIFKDNNLGYSVIGTKNNSYHSSKQEAIDAENNFIKSYYAKKLSVSRSYIDKMLKEDDQFLVKLQNTNFSLKENDINTDTEENVSYSLKNKNLNANSRIPYVVLKNYTNVAKNDYSALGTLEGKVKKLKRGTYQNDATGYSADINADTIRKAIHPTHNNFNPFADGHIRNLNAMAKLPELFKNAVYVDSKSPQKGKNQNPSYKEFHHFVAPLFMNNGEYRALITAREKVNSNTLYVLKVEVLPTQKRHTLSAAQQNNAVGSQWLSVPSHISIPELVNGVKIKNYDTNTEDTYTDADIRYSLKEIDNISSKDRKVSSSDKMVVRDGMTDEERYNILVNKSIENVPKVDNEKLKLMESKFIGPIREAYRLKATDRKKLFVKIGEEFEVFKNYRNEDIEVSFEFTKNGMRESEQHQKGNYENFAKLFSCFDEVIDRAIGIEVHNRNNEGYKVDKSLKEMYVLVSAFEDGKDIVPVKLEIKEFNDRANKLYVAVALEGIKKNEVVKQENTNNSVTQALARSNDEVVKSEFANKSRTDNSRSFNISLSQLLKKVNPKDQDFIKYIPKQFFEENKENLSLKNVETVPLKDLRNLVGVVEDLQTGKKGASERLAKYIDKGIITTEEYDELVKTYGAIPAGENPHRDIQVPQKTAKDKKVSQTVRTILEAKATPDEAVPTIEKMVEDGIFSYDVYTDKQALDEANSNIKKYGWDESVDDWFKDVEKGIVSKQHTAMGWALYNNAANIAATTTSQTERTSAIKTSLKILDAMVRHQRSAAQALQATRILKKLSPETQLYAAQKSVQAFQKELSDRYGDKAPNLDIDADLAEQFLNAKTPEERAEIETEIYKDIGRQMPSRFVDMWNAWRYLAMLGNVRTHVRNIGGNAFFAPVVMTKDLTATAIESIVHRVSGKKTVRGKVLITGSKADRELLKAAWEDYGTVADLISNGGKYSDFAMANQKIEDGRQIFKFKPLELARKGNSVLLEKEDMWFSKPHYAYALAQYCKANNITAEQIKRAKAIAPARDYAIKEAQKATYRDTNAFSQFVSDLGKNGKVNYVPKPVSMVVDGILPFRKTPANILVRGVEYSPLGLLKGLSYDLYQVSKGKMSATEAIDNISAGLTGTGLLGLGVYLAAQGLIRGHGEEDEEEKEFKELMGHQSYALELANGQSITLDWLAPESLPFFVGVNIWETTKGSDEELTLSTILNSVRNITEPMLEMSCLQGLNDLFEGIGYAKSNDTSGLVAVISSAVKSYLMQGLPTMLGQAERTGEEHRMTTYTEKDDFLTGDMQYTLGKASAKIPFWDYHQIPYIDAWGRKEASGVALKRGLNNFLNPAYTSTVKTSKMEKELLRLYESTGEASVFPSRADKYFTVDKKRKDLTADEYVRYATLKGKKSYKLITDLVKSDAYEILDDGEKVKAIEEAYDYANQKAKEAISNYKPDTWVSKADEFSDVGSYITFRTEVSATKKENGDKISRQEVADIILDMAQNDSDMWNMYLSMYDSKGDKYAYDSGVSGEAYMYFLETLNEVDTPNKSGKYGTYTQAEAKEAVNQLEGLSREEQRALWQSVNTTWKRNPF